MTKQFSAHFEPLAIFNMVPRAVGGERRPLNADIRPIQQPKIPAGGENVR